ncbi:MAG TPA: porin family protein [Alphaproteobacteria bacterium]
MKKYLLLTAAVFVLIPHAQAQDKYGSTYSNQVSTTSQSQATTAPVYHSTQTTTSTSDYGSEPLTGFYLGAEGGYGWSDLETTAGDLDLSGANYGLFAGYKMDHWLENMGIGMTGALEFHYDWSNAEEDVAGVTIEKDHEWGIDFRPGISISDNFNPYGIIGYERAQFSGSAGGLTGEENFDGFVLGAGTELVSWDKVGMRLDYTHTWYGEESGVDPDEDEVKLGLAYHF